MSKECKRLVNRAADLIARKRKERYSDVVRHVRTRIRFAMLRTTLIALRGYRSLSQPHLCPFDGVNYVFQHFVYIFVCYKFKNNGNNGPFPLLMYCALPIAPLDLIECIYIV